MRHPNRNRFSSSPAWPETHLFKSLDEWSGNLLRRTALRLHVTRPSLADAAVLIDDKVKGDTNKRSSLLIC